MRKTFLLLSVIGFLFSCSEDDSDSNSSENFTEDIIGTWRSVSYTSNGESFFECADVEIYDGTNRQYNELWGENCENISEGENNEPYTIKGDELTVNVPDEDPNDDIDDSYTEVYTITELSDEKMVLTDVYTEDGTEFTDISTYTRVK